MGVSRSLLTALDGFDENLRAGGTETDLAIRAQRLGATVETTAEAVVAYRVPGRANDMFAREFRRERGRAYLARRLGVGSSSWKSLAMRWVQLGSALMRYLRHGEGVDGLAVALARAFGGPIWRLRFWFHLPPFRGLSPS